MHGYNDASMKKYKYLNDQHIYINKFSVVILVICFQMFPLTAYGLAYWQWQRRKWKINLLKTIDERTAADPVPLTDL